MSQRIDLIELEREWRGQNASIQLLFRPENQRRNESRSTICIYFSPCERTFCASFAGEPRLGRELTTKTTNAIACCQFLSRCAWWRFGNEVLDSFNWIMNQIWNRRVTWSSRMDLTLERTWVLNFNNKMKKKTSWASHKILHRIRHVESPVKAWAIALEATRFY